MKFIKTIYLKKYSNRKLYAPKGELDDQGGYVKMKDVYRLIREGNDVVISDYKTGEEVTARALLESLSELDTDKDTILRMIRG